MRYVMTVSFNYFCLIQLQLNLVINFLVLKERRILQKA